MNIECYWSYEPIFFFIIGNRCSLAFNLMLFWYPFFRADIRSEKLWSTQALLELWNFWNVEIYEVAISKTKIHGIRLVPSILLLSILEWIWVNAVKSNFKTLPFIKNIFLSFHSLFVWISSGNFFCLTLFIL